MANQDSELIKFDVCLYKSDNVTYDEFAKYVEVDYPPKGVVIMKKYGIVRWATTVLPPQGREENRNILKQLGRNEWSVPDYDAVLSYWLKDMKDMMAMAASPEWDELEKESDHYANMKIGHFVVGRQLVHLNNNASA